MMSLATQQRVSLRAHLFKYSVHCTVNSFEWLDRNMWLENARPRPKNQLVDYCGATNQIIENESAPRYREIFHRQNWKLSEDTFSETTACVCRVLLWYYFSRGKKKVICWFPGSLTRSSGRPVPSIFKEPTKKLRTKPLAFCLMQQSPLVQKRKCHRVMIQTSKTIAFCSTDAKFNRGERGPTRPIVWDSEGQGTEGTDLGSLGRFTPY
jgi:hypothetical protein